MDLRTYRELLATGAALRQEQAAHRDRAYRALRIEDYETWGHANEAARYCAARLELVRDELRAADGLPRDDDCLLAAYAWPGGYPVIYRAADGGTICAACARDAEAAELTGDSSDEQWELIAGENTSLWDEAPICDHCGREVV